MVIIDKERCIGCGACVPDCVSKHIRLEDGKAVKTGECILCGHCVAVCPTGAVSIPEYDAPAGEPGFPITIEDLLTTIRSRRSIRYYQPRQVEREKFEAILEAGRYTATGSNRQDCTFVVVQQELETFKRILWSWIEDTLSSEDPAPAEHLRDFLDRIRRDPKDDFLFRNAPAVLVVAARSQVDAGLAAQDMELAAVYQGLGVMYNGYLAGAVSACAAAREWLGIGEKPAALSMLVGYPDVRYRRIAPRRAVDAVWR